MKALVRVPGGVSVAEQPDPEPGPEDVVVAVHSCGICGSDVHAAEAGVLRPGSIPGHEFSGWVESVAARVEGFVPGCEVFGMNSWFSQGALAEYCIARPQDVAAKPKSLTHTEAASVPISALTAWQGCREVRRNRGSCLSWVITGSCVRRRATSAAT